MYVPTLNLVFPFIIGKCIHLTTVYNDITYWLKAIQLNFVI